MDNGGTDRFEGFDGRFDPFQGDVPAPLEVGFDVVIAPDVYQYEGDFIGLELKREGAVMKFAFGGGCPTGQVVMAEVEVQGFHGKDAFRKMVGVLWFGERQYVEERQRRQAVRGENRWTGTPKNRDKARCPVADSLFGISGFCILSIQFVGGMNACVKGGTEEKGQIEKCKPEHDTWQAFQCGEKEQAQADEPDIKDALDDEQRGDGFFHFDLRLKIRCVGFP